ncbi:hypothetical protein DRJ48_04740 [Candidatus Woesearchaeota archaeon]|nr:translation initiation factor eIF-2B [Candidatus Woesearchaeota archaeon]RLE41845.1 MAG: hypothetical protein DRJ48_04740 [Candidatus Woesearchaeota archaeon]
MDYKGTAKAITQLRIQGAQSIALAGVKSLFYCKTLDEVKKAVKLLAKARPTEPCLRNALHYVTKGLSRAKFKTELQARIKWVCEYFKDSNERIKLYGSRRIKPSSVVFTHCHSSTVTSILIKAKQERKNFVVHNTETRPFFQGRITARELARAGIRVVHFVDSAARLALKGADIMLIGADAITSEGFVINKIGSEMFAEIANSYEIPVYVCCHSWKYDGKTQFGFDERIEQRFSKEVWQRPPRGVEICNIVFERVHPRLISGVISEFGITTIEGFLEQVKNTFPWLS